MMRIMTDGRFEETPSKVVYKYQVGLYAGPQKVMIPVGSTLVHSEFIDVFGHYGFLLWYEVRLDKVDEKITHIYQVFGTGDASIPKMAKHVTTGIQWYYGHRDERTFPRLVRHLFEYPTGSKIVDA